MAQLVERRATNWQLQSRYEFESHVIHLILQIFLIFPNFKDQKRAYSQKLSKSDFAHDVVHNLELILA